MKLCTRFKIKLTPPALVALAVGFGFLAMAAETQSKPNVVVILTDDQGYGDLSCYGSNVIETPNIDGMAAEGIRLTHFYSASSVCSPSRAALLTGRMPKRVGVPGVLFPYSTSGLPSEEITLAELLKEQGYRTALVGKWHLGHQKKFLPTQQGFDQFFGLPYSNDMTIAKELKFAAGATLNNGYTRTMVDQDIATYEDEYKKVRKKVPLMRNNAVIEYPVDQKTLTRRYTEEALAFIDSASDQPFFLYLAHSMPHKPLSVEESLAGRSKAGLYGDVIEQIDWSVGEILHALKAKGLDEKTLVFFSSDNGPWQTKYKSSGPFRGTKFCTFEGGHRVPAIFWAPGKVEAGGVSDGMACSTDLFPTIAHYAGISLPQDRTYDGYDLMALLEGRTNESPRKAFYYYVMNSEVIDGVRIGDWKYLLRGPRNPKIDQVTPQLYNLKDDPGEQHNLVNTYPERAAELEQCMKDYDATAKEH